MKVIIDYDFSKKKGIIVSEYLSNIREFFSVEDKQQVFKRRFAVGYRPQTRVYVITPQGRFEPRFVCDIVSYINTLRDTGVTVTLDITDSFKENTQIPALEVNVSKLNLPLRDYQEEAVLSCLNCGSGIVLLPTSAGKTLTVATLCMSITDQLPVNDRKTLILVPDIQLVQQTYSDFLEYGIEESRLTRWTGSHEPRCESDIIIANSQILLSKKQDLSVLKDVRLLLVDEVHKCKRTNSISKVVRSIPAHYRFGFTGTMPVDQIDCWSIKGMIGDTIYQKKSVELREQKFISNVNVGVILLKHKNRPYFKTATAANPTAEYEEEILFLQTNAFRNETILKLVSKVDKNALIMVDRINHGEELLGVMQELTDKQVFFVQGSVEIEERERIRQIMELNDNVVCIAISRIFSTGVNIRNLHYVIFASIGKAKNKIIQSIGRSLRLHASKKCAYIIDIADNLKYSEQHLQERLGFYKTETINTVIKEIHEE